MQDLSVSLNKYISSTGVCSRREADKWIASGRVKINGKVAKKGNRVELSDTVYVDGSPLHNNTSKPVYIALHKPPGITSTTNAKDRDNIISFIDYPVRIFPIGRLDKSSTGLILLTNDGDIVNKILRAEHNHEKEYIVSVNRPITTQFIQSMAKGVPVLGTVTKRCVVEKKSKFVFKIILTQGLNRQIRRMCEFLGYKVISLKRVRIMNIELGNLKVGRWRNLTREEMRGLHQDLK